MGHYWQSLFNSTKIKRGSNWICFRYLWQYASSLNIFRLNFTLTECLLNTLLLQQPNTAICVILALEIYLNPSVLNIKDVPKDVTFLPELSYCVKSVRPILYKDAIIMNMLQNNFLLIYTEKTMKYCRGIILQSLFSMKYLYCFLLLSLLMFTAEKCDTHTIQILI